MPSLPGEGKQITLLSKHPREPIDLQPWHLAHMGLLPFPALPVLGKSHMARQSHGEGGKNMEGGGGKT